MPQPQQHPADLRFCEQVRTLFSDACQIARRRDTGQLTFTQARAKIPSLYNSLQRICKSSRHHPDAENLRQRLLDPKRDYHRLFTFLRVNRMPPTNNYAEQTLRAPVIFRKIIFGNRSDQGAHAMATRLAEAYGVARVNLSLLSTAKCRKLDPIALLKTTFLSGHEAASARLFNDSS